MARFPVPGSPVHENYRLVPCVAETVGRGSATCQLSPVEESKIDFVSEKRAFSSSREATRDGALARARGPAHRNHHVV